jgi:hypothetical protein
VNPGAPCSRANDSNSRRRATNCRIASAAATVVLIWCGVHGASSPSGPGNSGTRAASQSASARSTAYAAPR